jgi:bacillolysin
MRIYPARLPLCILLFCFTSSVFAQLNDTVSVRRDEKGRVRNFSFRKGNQLLVNSKNELLKQLLNGESDDEFLENRKSLSENGIQHSWFQHFYKGIKVENNTYSLHQKDKELFNANGNYEKVALSSVMPVITGEQAISKAMAFVNASKYKWQDSSEQKEARIRTKDPNASFYPKPELVISKDILGKTSQMRLCWKMIISSSVPDRSQVIFVDAYDGHILGYMPLSFDSNVTCTADTKYSGTQSITGDSFGGGYRLQETRNGVDIYTKNFSGFSDIVNSSTNFTSAGWSSFSSDRHALDAHWAAEKVLDFWQTVFSRNSVDDNGLPLLTYVHWNAVGAIWDGDPLKYYVKLGDGNSSYLPFTTLDIVAHEFGHAINQLTGIGMAYDVNSETAALHEGIADIWGACVEYWVDPTKQTWKMGEEMDVNYPSIRSLENPKTDGDPTQSENGKYPNTYKSGNWDGANGPHANATVIGHWFYILVNGKTGTNDKGDAFNVAGIGIAKSQQIVYKALTTYIGTTIPQFMDMRDATILAVQNLYGSGSCEERAVTNAWNAVGVGGLYTSGSTPIISGAEYICSAETYTLSNIPSGGTITWAVSNSADVTYTTSGNTISVTKNPGTIAAIASISATISGCNIFAAIPVTIGTPGIHGTYGNDFDHSSYPLGIYPDVTNTACMRYYINTDVKLIGATSSAVWSKSSSTMGLVLWSQIGNNLQFYLYGNGQEAIFKLDVSNPCGPRSIEFKWVAYNCPDTEDGCNSFSMSPNPSNGNIIIGVPSVIPPCDNFTAAMKKAKKPKSELIIKEIRVYDNLRNVRKIIKGSNAKQVRFQAGELKNGVYFVEIIGTNNYTETQQLIIHH